MSSWWDKHIRRADEFLHRGNSSTLHSMVDGTVTEKWAWTHHPAWYRAVTGHDPRQDYEREKQRQIEREQAIQDQREQDRHETRGTNTNKN